MVFNFVGTNDAVKNVKVRQAVNYALNKRNIAQVVGGTKVAAPTGQVFSESVVGKGFEQQDLYKTQDFAGDPAKAKQLLTEAGFPNGITLVMSYRSSGNGPKIAETIVQDMKASGITITPKQVPARDFYSKFMQKPEIAKAGQWDIAPARLVARLGGRRGALLLHAAARRPGLRPRQHQLRRLQQRGRERGCGQGPGHDRRRLLGQAVDGRSTRWSWRTPPGRRSSTRRRRTTSPAG